MDRKSLGSGSTGSRDLSQDSAGARSISKDGSIAGEGSIGDRGVSEKIEEEELEVYQLPPKRGEYYYQEYGYVRPTQAQYDHRQVQDSKLFDKTKRVIEEQGEDVLEDVEPFRDASILVTGFGMRNVDSFQELLKKSHAEREQWELRKLWREKKAKEEIERQHERERAEATARTETTEATTSAASSRQSSTDFLTQTETPTEVNQRSNKRERLDYLLGLEPEAEEKSATEWEEDELAADTFKYSSSKSIREAQRYLRVHRIFECFQFIIAHLLSANAENPIEFILNLLNRCLLYRSGLGDPPLLYEKKHINQLFTLMDRLQSGFIDFEQYKSGMKSLGVCTFNETPDISAEDLISKETFIEEAYEAELAIFNEFIKRRPEKAKKTEHMTPFQFQSVSVTSINPPFFIPSDLLKFRQHSIQHLDNYNDG